MLVSLLLRCSWTSSLQKELAGLLCGESSFVHLLEAIANSTGMFMFLCITLHFFFYQILDFF